MLFSSIFIAGTCHCDGNGHCIVTNDGGDTVACVNFADPDSGTNETCRGTASDGGGGPTAVPTATATPTPNWTQVFKDRIGGYEFPDYQCTEQPGPDGAPDGGGDPFTLVIRSQVAVDEHLDHHGLHDDINNNTIEIFAAQFKENRTHFRDDGYCAWSEILRGQPEGFHVCGYIPFTNIPNAWCLQDRLHVRGHTQTLPDPQYPNLQVTALTPHYDTAYPAGIGTTCEDAHAPEVYNAHVVLENQLGRGISGFTAARNDVVALWLAGGQHFVLATQIWSNEHPRQQCNGDIARADGTVVMLATCTDFPGMC